MAVRKAIAWGALVVLVVGLLLFFIRAAPAPLLTSRDSSESSEKIFDLEIKNSTIVSGPSVLSTNQGDTVTINVIIHTEEEFHLHGYDKELTLEPGMKGTVTFVADISGRFPIELHHSQTEIAALEVQP